MDRASRPGIPIRVGAVIALALAIAFVVWILVRDTGDRAGTKAAERAPVAEPASRRLRKPGLLVAATVKELTTLAAIVEYPIYWAGPKPGVKYELTHTPDGRIYIRYLPAGVKIGDRRGKYLIVATYPVKNGYKAVQNAAKANGAVVMRLPRHGLAVFNVSAPTNVYFAYPGRSYQVEVYDPDPLRARELVLSGQIRPVR